MPGPRLTRTEREEIAIGTALGETLDEIAGRIGRAPSTVSRERSRNRAHGGVYRAGVAQGEADVRARRPRVCRLVGDRALAALVEGLLEQRWSPQQIAGRLRVEHPDQPERRVSHETIYRALYMQGRGGLRAELTEALRTGRTRRRPAGANPGRRTRGTIVGMVNIVERTTRFTLLVALPDDRRAITVADAIATQIRRLPQELLRSLTWDQGKEMAAHAKFTVDTGVQVYFCDPHSPWQRGTNENTNGLLRQYFPKGTDLSRHTQEDLDIVAAQLNGRPRQTLGFATPSEKLNELLLATTT